MSDNDYLKKVLASQTLAAESEELKSLQSHRSDVETVLRESFKDSSPTIKYGGSKAKGTMIREAYDLDIICYFDHEDTKAGETLKGIYTNCEEALKEKYTVERKPSALRLKSLGTDSDHEDFHIDVVPGRYIDDSNSDVFLYRSSGEKERQKTNLEVHISHVKNSGVIDAIRLLKLWRVRNDLKVKHFVLDLLTIEILRKKRKSELTDQLTHAWKEMADNIDDISIEDPANPTGNDLSDIFDGEIKRSLQSAAKDTLRIISESGWEAVFGEMLDEEQENIELADSSHRQVMFWEEDQKYRAHIDASIWNEHKTKCLGGLNSDGRTLPARLNLRYKVTTSAPPPYEVFWQVVNTGEHAKRIKGGLRGEIFAANKNHPSIQWESTLYHGKHWIECFIVKDGYCVARDRFYVKVRTPYF